MRGMLVGMALDKTVGDLALRYLATAEAIALQTRQIVDSMNDKGHDIKYIFMSGGLVKNKVLMKLIADACNMPVQLPFSHSASVVLGSAMLGAVAAEELSSSGPITSQDAAEKRSHGMKEKLWHFMVRRDLLPASDRKLTSRRSTRWQSPATRCYRARPSKS